MNIDSFSANFSENVYYTLQDYRKGGLHISQLSGFQVAAEAEPEVFVSHCDPTLTRTGR